MKKISILGCGWLGFPLAKKLLNNHFLVDGSTTSLSKINLLQNAGINAFQINLLEDKIEGEIENFLANTDILIIDIPPKLRGDAKENFVAKIQNLVPFIEKASVKKVIFISSTSVYSDTYLIENSTEDSALNPNTESGKQLLETENLLLKNKKFKTIIIRFGGLIGEDRNPVKFLSGKKNIENPDAPVNLIHQEDCISIIETLILINENNNQVWNEIYNAVYPFHPSRKEYYTEKAIEQNLEEPQFETSINSVGKIISSKKIQNILEYTFIRKI